MKEKEKCPICGKLKEDVCERRDAYACDIGNEEDATMISCKECAKENALDI